MFQTFSGNSRRPRQVNLSGHNPNPFATNSWGSATATQQTVASAQQERQQRQIERERLNASRQIQRIWRGHKVRTDVANSQRRVWDEVEKENRGSSRLDVLTEQLRFLVLFYSSKEAHDQARLLNLSQRISSFGSSEFLTAQSIQSKLTKIAAITLNALETYFIPTSDRNAFTDRI